MSSDNGIYVLKTPKGFDFSGKQVYEYRVAELQAIDNLDWHVCSVHGSNTYKYRDVCKECTEAKECREPDCQIKNAREMFGHAHVFGTKQEALMQAGRISDDIYKYGFPLEYGICDIHINREF